MSSSRKRAKAQIVGEISISLEIVGPIDLDECEVIGELSIPNVEYYDEEAREYNVKYFNRGDFKLQKEAWYAMAEADGFVDIEAHDKSEYQISREKFEVPRASIEAAENVQGKATLSSYDPFYSRPKMNSTSDEMGISDGPSRASLGELYQYGDLLDDYQLHCEILERLDFKKTFIMGARDRGDRLRNAKRNYHIFCLLAEGAAAEEVAWRIPKEGSGNWTPKTVRNNITVVIEMYIRGGRIKQGRDGACKWVATHYLEAKFNPLPVPERTSNQAVSMKLPIPPLVRSDVYRSDVEACHREVTAFRTWEESLLKNTD